MQLNLKTLNLTISLSKYKDRNLNLSYAHNDAKKFQQLLIDKCRFKKENIKLLTNKNASRENIRKSIEGWLYNNARKEDNVIVFFSGHGTRDTDNDGDELDKLDEFLVPYDYDKNDVSSCIRDDIFAYWIKSLKSENILLVLDSCFSGGAGKVKGFNKKGTKGFTIGDSLIKDIFKEIPRKGIALLASSMDTQVSFEEDQFAMGVFTYFLIKSIEKKSDQNLDNVITLTELYDSLKFRVSKFIKENLKKEQEPILINQIEKNFDFAYLGDKKLIKGNKAKADLILKKASLLNDYKKKEKHLEDALLIDPMNLDVRSALAWCYTWNEKYDKAIYHYEVLTSIYAKKGYMYKHYVYGQIFDIAKIYRKKGDLDKAIKYLKKSIDLNRNDDRSIISIYDRLNEKYKLLGDIYKEKGDYSGAIENYLLSIKQNEIQDEVYFNLSQTYIQIEKFDLALEILKKGISINPSFFKFYYLVGVLQKYVFKDINESEKNFKKFFNSHNKFLIYWNYLNNSIDYFLKYWKIEKKFSTEKAEEEFNLLENFIKDNKFFLDAYMKLFKFCRELNILLDRQQYIKKELFKIYPFLKTVDVY